MLSPRSYLSAILLLLFSLGYITPVSGDSADTEDKEELEIVIGQKLHEATASVCVTRKQAEAVVLVYQIKGFDEAKRAFSELNCFTVAMSIVPQSLISSQRIGMRTVSIVKVTAETGLTSRHTVYMITHNPVILGTRV